MNVEQMLHVAREHLITIGGNARLVEAAALLSGKRADLLIVCDPAGRMAGVITRRDIVSRISRCKGAACSASVASAMSRDVVHCGPGETLQAIWARMKETGYVHIPVIDQEDRPLGTLSARDTLQALLREAEYEEELLRDYVMGIGYH